KFRVARAERAGEGFADVHVVVPEPAGAAVRPEPSAAVAVADASARLRFGLSLSRFDWPGGAAGLRDGIRRVAADAEAAGFESIWLMDHVRQIPQVGRAWEDLPEAMTTLGYLAACTSRARLGALVAGITYRNVAHLGRIVA